MRTPALIASIATVFLSVAAGPGLAAGESVTFVDNVRCNAGACETQLKTVPVLETVRGREPLTPAFCHEYTRRLTGFLTYPSVDPSVSIQIPQIEESGRRHFRCGRGEELALAR